MDYTLYLVTDAGLSQGRTHAEVVEAAIRGGVTVVQYREKSAPTRRMIEEAREIRQLSRAAGVPFIVNDRVDVALAVDADGVHVGQDDMPAAVARRLIGEDPGSLRGERGGSAQGGGGRRGLHRCKPGFCNAHQARCAAGHWH